MQDGFKTEVFKVGESRIFVRVIGAEHLSLKCDRAADGTWTKMLLGVDQSNYWRKLSGIWSKAGEPDGRDLMDWLKRGVL